MLRNVWQKDYFDDISGDYRSSTAAIPRRAGATRRRQDRAPPTEYYRITSPAASARVRDGRAVRTGRVLDIAWSRTSAERAEQSSRRGEHVPTVHALAEWTSPSTRWSRPSALRDGRRAGEGDTRCRRYTDCSPRRVAAGFTAESSGGQSLSTCWCRQRAGERRAVREGTGADDPRGPDEGDDRVVAPFERADHGARDRTRFSTSAGPDEGQGGHRAQRKGHAAALESMRAEAPRRQGRRNGNREYNQAGNKA